MKTEDQVETQEEAAPEDESVYTINVMEGDLVKLNLKATDPDGDPLYYTFSEPLNEEGMWQTKKGDGGVYNASVMVTDGDYVTVDYFCDNMLVIIYDEQSEDYWIIAADEYRKLSTSPKNRDITGV